MDDFTKFQRIALRFLSYRPRSEKEVRDKLQEYANKRHSGKPKAHPESGDIQQIIEKVMVFLQEHKFINDTEFAKMWIRQRTEFNTKSLRVIKMELKQKGIDKDLIENILHTTYDIQHTDLDRAKSLVSKKLPKYAGLSQYELLQKLGPYLARRGFDYDTIKKAINTLDKDDIV